MKKIIFIVVVISIVILISIKVKNNNQYAFSIGNKAGLYNYLYYDTRIEDIIYDIDNNIYIRDKHIQNIITNANNIYIDLNGLYINIKSLYYIEELVKKIRNYTDKKLIIYARKDNDILSKSLNNMIFNIRNKYDIIIKR